MGNLTKNFGFDTDSNLRCPCCGSSSINLPSIERLQRVRDDYGKRIGIVAGGGYRCDSYDNSSSAHKEGRAFDIDYPREDHFLLLSLAFKHGFTGLGDKNKSGKFQMHMDDAESIQGKRIRPAKWTY